jgi:outer membrane biosynthesis protein TonB
MSKRAMTIFSLTFAAVLLAGVAFAQVGAWYEEGATAETAFGRSADEVEDILDADEPEPPADEPSEESKHEEPAESPKDETPGEEQPEPEPAESEQATEEEPEEAPAEESGEVSAQVWIEILFPAPEQRTDDKIQVFEGRVSPGARVFRGKYEADVSSDGAWRIALVLSAGKNHVTFEAVDGEGRSATASVVVFYDAPEKEPKEEPQEEPKETDWTAQQKYGENSGNPPYDIFYGTGTPDAKVSITSAYGSGTTEIGPKGHWDLKVVFPEAPCGAEFKVVIESSEGDRSVFHFVRICESEKDV